MTKAEIVTNISEKLGVEKNDTQEIVNHFMKEVRSALESSLW